VDSFERRTRLAARLDDLGVDAFLVTRLPNVRFLTGFTGSNGQLLLSKDRSVFLTDGRYTEQSRHEVPDADRVSYSGEFAPAFLRVAAEVGVRRLAFESAGVTHRTFSSLSVPDLDLVPTTDEVERLRWIKSRDEIANLDAAQGIADDAFDLITGKLTEGMSEREVAFELDMAMRKGGAEAVAFDSIVAFGESSAEPHHGPGDRQLQRGDVVKLDFGCVVAGYHSDMTRTVAFGEPDARLREIYQVVRRAQQAGVDSVRAGAEGGDVDEVAREIIRDAGYGDHYTHSLGHGVGLEVHEGPTLRVASQDVLPEGTVVTVEPGIYVGGLGGVRIEDMVEVTADGCRVIPRTTKDLVVL
jgi:Xaa-Pro aminopeptidase